MSETAENSSVKAQTTVFQMRGSKEDVAAIQNKLNTLNMKNGIEKLAWLNSLLDAELARSTYEDRVGEIDAVKNLTDQLSAILLGSIQISAAQVAAEKKQGEERLGLLQKENLQLKEKLAGRKETNDKLARLEKENRELKQQLSLQEAQLEKERMQAREEAFRIYRAETAQAQQEMNALNRQLGQLEAEKQAGEQEKQKLQHTIEELETRLKELQKGKEASQNS